MRVRLADPFGDPLSIGKGDPRIRSLRKEGTGSGGGTGDGGTGDGGDGSSEEENEESEEDESEEEEEEEKPEKNPELVKAIRARDRAKAEARALREKLAEKEGKDDNEPSAEEKANAKIVRSSARALLAANGITEKDDQAEVLGMLNLSDIEVDSDGDPDEDEIEERIATLRRVFGGAPNRRVPKSSAKDRGGNSKETTDPDAARYRRIIGARR